MPLILIADDHDLVRETIAAYLNKVDTFSVKVVADLPLALEASRSENTIDLVILDYHMPGMNGLRGLDEYRREFPQTKVALLSGVAERDVATAAMEHGAVGFLPKSLTAEALINAIKLIISGERYFPFDFAAAPPAAILKTPFTELSAREMETLEQLCKGLANKEIARKLGIQEVTVKLHVKNLLAKLKVSNRTQAALLAKEHKIF